MESRNRMKLENISIIIAVIALSISIIGYVYAESSNITLDIAPIGKELTVHVTNEYTNSAYGNTEPYKGKIFASMSDEDGIIDENYCYMYPRTGHCSIPFKLTDGVYNPGNYTLNVQIGEKEYSYMVWLWERTV